MFTSVLLPLTVKSGSANEWENRELAGGSPCSGLTLATAMRSSGNDCASARRFDGLDGGVVGLVCYVDALPPAARFIRPTGGVRVSSVTSEDSSGDETGSHGVQAADGTNDAGAAQDIGGTQGAHIDTHTVDENPEVRPWREDDFSGSGAGNVAVVVSAARPASNYIYFHQVQIAVDWERDPQPGIYELIAPYLPLPLAAIFGGLAHARVDMRAFAGAVYRLSERRLWWDAAEDLALERELRAYRWPRVFDLGATRRRLLVGA